MLKSLEFGSKGLLAQNIKNDIIANNLANIGSSGFKRELAKFSQEAVTARGEQQLELVVSSATDFSNGFIRPTQNPMDLAIEGDGFFVVETPEGERYTRAGSLTLNENNQLITASGHAVLGSSGPIVVSLEEGRLEFAQDGNVTVGGVSVSALRIVKFEDMSQLQRQGERLFRASPGATPQDVDRKEVRIITGFLEGSNINPLREMVEMITALRTFQAIEKSVKASDEVLDVMINQVGRLPENGA